MVVVAAPQIATTGSALWLVAGAGAAITVGVVVALVVVKRPSTGGGTEPGAASRDAAARATFKSLGDGGCSAAIARVVLLGASDASIMNTLEAPVLSRCNADHWSADVIACCTDATALSTVHTCFAKLTPAQRTGLDSAIKPILDATAPSAELRATFAP